MLQNDPSGLVQDLCGCVTEQFLCCAFVRNGLRSWEQGLPLFSAAHSLLTTGNTSTEELLETLCLVRCETEEDLNT